MKKQESFRILCKGRIIYKDLTQDEMFDIMDDLSAEYHETGLPNPDDLVVECVGTEE